MLPYLIFDVVFDEIFRFSPDNKNQKTIFYSSICVTLVKEFTKDKVFEFGPCVGEALQTIFGNEDTSGDSQGSQSKLEEMDLELVDRLLEWLAFFLSQQGFAWDWDSWTFVVGLPDYSIQKVFIRNLLAKCRNIAYVKTLIEVLPEQLHEMIDVERNGVFENVNKDNYEAQIILESINTKEDVFIKGEVSVDTSSEQFVDLFIE